MTASAKIIRAERSKVPGLRQGMSPAQLGGTTSIHDGLVAPGELIPPHTHAHEDQCVYVVSGALRLEIDGELIEAPHGDTAAELIDRHHLHLGGTAKVAITITVASSDRPAL